MLAIVLRCFGLRKSQDLGLTVEVCGNLDSQMRNGSVGPVKSMSLATLLRMCVLGGWDAKGS